MEETHEQRQRRLDIDGLVLLRSMIKLNHDRSVENQANIDLHTERMDAISNRLDDEPVKSDEDQQKAQDMEETHEQRQRRLDDIKAEVIGNITNLARENAYRRLRDIRGSLDFIMDTMVDGYMQREALTHGETETDES